jgi:hypothetical protein
MADLAWAFGTAPADSRSAFFFLLLKIQSYENNKPFENV